MALYTTHSWYRITVEAMGSNDWHKLLWAQAPHYVELAPVGHATHHDLRVVWSCGEEQSCTLMACMGGAKLRCGSSFTHIEKAGAEALLDPYDGLVVEGGSLRLVACTSIGSVMWIL